MEEEDFLRDLRNLLPPLSVFSVRREKWHIREIVDHEYIVYRVWSRYKKRWVYYCEWYYTFYLAYNDGKVKKHAPDKA